MDSSKLSRWGIAAAAAVVLAFASAPIFGYGADHLDAPGLTSPETRSDADINDVYVFQGANDARTAIAVTTHPAAGAIAPLRYARDVKYKINIDTDGDALEDLAYVWRFGRTEKGRQTYKVNQYTGDGARTLTGGSMLGAGRTDKTIRIKGGGKSFAGLRSDPFFFDLDAFRGAVLGEDNGRTFCDQDGGTAGIDFFASLNSNAIVMEVPDAVLGTNIGVWATTIGEDGQIDRMGRPAINTVFNSGADKNAFNAGQPRDDFEVFGDNLRAVLKTFSALDSEGPYTDDQLETLTSVLLPDMLTYDTSTTAAGPLNGRGPSDDVIDVELNVVTGGFSFEGRDDVGAIGGDCVGPHDDYLATFPYLGEPH